MLKFIILNYFFYCRIKYFYITPECKCIMISYDFVYAGSFALLAILAQLDVKEQEIITPFKENNVYKLEKKKRKNIIIYLFKT